MNKSIKNLEKWAPVILRYGMSAVILWFGFQQFLHTESWTAYVPDSIVSMTGISAITLVYVNATFEVVFGFLMVFGWQTRLVSLLLGLHMLDIMWVVGYGEIGVRDFGLAIATLVVFMNGSDFLCVTEKKVQIETAATMQQAPKMRVSS